MIFIQLEGGLTSFRLSGVTIFKTSNFNLLLAIKYRLLLGLGIYFEGGRLIYFLVTRGVDFLIVPRDLIFFLHCCPNLPDPSTTTIKQPRPYTSSPSHNTSVMEGSESHVLLIPVTPVMEGSESYMCYLYQYPQS